MSQQTRSRVRLSAMAKTSSGAFAGVVFGAMSSFATIWIVSNTVGDSGAGVFFQILAFFAIATTACTFGADTALVKTIAEQRALGQGDGIPKTMRIASWPVVLAAIMAGAAAWFSAPALSRLLDYDGAAALIRLLACFVLTGVLLNLSYGALRGFGRIGTFTLLQNVLLPVMRFAAVTTVVILGAGTFALATGWVVPAALTACLAALLLWATWKHEADNHTEAINPSHSIPVIAPVAGSMPDTVATSAAEALPGLRLQRSRFWKFSSGRGASALLEIVLEWIDVLLVGVFLGPAAAGVYGVVNRCVRMGQMAEHSARIVTGPILSAALAVDDLERARMIFRSATRVLVLAAWPFYLVLIIFGHALLAFFGPEFTAGYPALVIISTAMCLAVSAGGVQSVLLMAGRSHWQMLNKAAALTVAVPLNLLLIPALGIPGAAFAWTAAVVTDCSLATWQVHRYLKIRTSPRVLVLPAALALTLFGAGGLLVQWMTDASLQITGVALVVISFGILYLTLIWTLRGRLGLATVIRRH